MEAQLLGSDDSSSKSEGFTGTEDSDELDHVPLLRRRRILLANQQRSSSNGCKGNGNPLTFGVVKEEDDGCDAPAAPSLTLACFPGETRVGISEQEQSDRCEDPEEVSRRGLCGTRVQLSAVGYCLQNENCNQDVGGTPGDCLSDRSRQIKCEDSDGNSQIGKLEAPQKIQVESSDNLLMQSEGCGMDSSSGAGVVITKIKDEVCDYVDDERLDHVVLKERLRMLLSRKLLNSAKSVREDSFEELSVDPLQTEKTNLVTLAPLAAEDDKNVSSTSTSFKIKDELRDDYNCHNLGTDTSNTFSVSTTSMKTKSEISNGLDEDEEEHVCLGDRLKQQRSHGDSGCNMSRKYAFLHKSVPSDTNSSPIASEHAKAFSTNRPRKRKKTATVSVATALEEDAPGLLQELVEKGVLVHEIKLYGEIESDDIDESSIEESFSDLGSVISKIFTQRQSFLKFAPIRFSKGARASYCLACLISLVEQARYVQFRKWPVEWGWCRDLKSFIFIFEKHNRIVLERPEYGYATYFFELVDSLPIDWQIKRLVTSMKLTSCSRISLIENKALLVGEDLTEGEAKVLIGYGWVPNSGLGTMLNYCDRVVHDRKNEKDTSEWRSKIGKLLMDGYNGGTIVATYSPEKDYGKDSQSTAIKLEL